MKAVNIKVVFDRKNVSDNNQKQGLVQIEVIYNRKQMFFSTGIKVFKNQWDKNRSCVKNSLHSDAYNKVIEALIGRVAEYNAKCIEENIEFSFSALKAYLSTHDVSQNFIQFMEKRINGRKDIKESTRRTQLAVCRDVKSFGLINSFGDVTVANIARYDEYLHNQNLRQTTIYSHHKVLKKVINDAILYEKLSFNPYSRFKIERGKPRMGRFVREEDMDKVIRCKIPSVLEKVRDLAVVQYYTGLSVSDLFKFDFSKVEKYGDDYAVIDRRQKTEETFYILLFEPVMNVLRKYGYILPKLTQVQYDLRLKALFNHAGISYADEVSSHWLRKGYGYYMLNHGVPMEVVSKSLGHASIKTTESVYAKILPKTVFAELGKISKKIGRQK